MRKFKGIVSVNISSEVTVVPLIAFQIDVTVNAFMHALHKLLGKKKLIFFVAE